MIGRQIFAGLALLALSLLGSTTLTGCSDAASKEECAKLMNHLISIEMAAGGGGAVSSELEADRDAVKKRVIGHLEDDFMKSCEKSLPKSQVDCGLRAKNPKELVACDEPSG